MNSFTMMVAPTPILFTIPNFITAGSGRMMLNIVENLDRTKFAPAVCVMKKGGTLDHEVEKMDIPFLEAPFVVPARPVGKLAASVWNAAKVFRPYHFAIWHSFHYGDDYTEPLIARLAGAKVWLYTKKNMSWGSRGWLVRSFLASRIVMDNTDMDRLMFNRPGLSGKTRLIHHSVAIEQYRPGVSPSLNLRGQLGIPLQAVVAACVAHLVPIKGHPHLLRAVHQTPDVHLLLAGISLDTNYAAELEKLACDLELTSRVHFLGGVSQIPALLAETDIFVLPTIGRGEGCPVSLLEAMASGKACVATDVPGSRDLIVHGESGWLVPPEDPAALAQALCLLIRDRELRMRLGQDARKRVEQHFTLAQEVARHESLYAEALA